MSAFHPLRTLPRTFMSPCMNRRLLFALLPSLVAFDAAPAAAGLVDKAKEVARIESVCGLKKGTITATGDEIRLQPSPDEAYEHVDCALARLNKAGLGKLGFVGNAPDPNAILRLPDRYIVKGSSAEIASLVKAAKADKWGIDVTATASDGMTFVELESGATMTHGQAGELLDRIWKNEFGNIAVGMAPRKLSDPVTFDD